METRNLEMADPTFECGSEHEAVAMVTNPTSATFTYDFELYLVDPATGEVGATTPGPAYVDAGQTKPLTFAVKMPQVEKTWDVYLDVSVEGQRIAHYKAAEKVTTVISEVVPDIEVISVTWE